MQEAGGSASEPKQYPFISDRERYLFGWPGYRTCPEKSGLAPAESDAELAHVQGILLKRAITGGVITRNPIYQLFLFIVGVIWCLPLIPAIEGIARGEYWLGIVIISAVPQIAVGGLILVNLAICIFGNPDGESLTGD